MFIAGYVGQQSPPAIRHNGYYYDVTATPAASRDPYHFRSQGWKQAINSHKRVPHSDITSLMSDVTAAARTESVSGLSSVVSLLDEAPLFYMALTSGASFAACLSSACPSCVVALVAMTSFISFVVDSARRYVITNVTTR